MLLLNINVQFIAVTKSIIDLKVAVFKYQHDQIFVKVNLFHCNMSEIVCLCFQLTIELYLTIRHHQSPIHDSQLKYQPFLYLKYSIHLTICVESKIMSMFDLIS